MAQSGYTPILIYGSGTTGAQPDPANLTSSASGAELALNYFDGKLFYKDASNNVQVLAVKMPSGVLPIANGGTNASSFTAKSGNVAGLVFFDGTKLTNDATVTDIGYDTSTNTLKANNFALSGNVTSNLLFTDNTYDIGASGATRPRNLYLSGDATLGGGTATTNAVLTISTINATPANVRTTFTQSYNGQLTINNDAGGNATTATNRQFVFQIIGTQKLNLSAYGLYIGNGTNSTNWAANHAVLQLGATGSDYGALSQQTTSNCANSLSWNATAVTGDDVWVYRGGGNYAARIRQAGGETYFQGSAVNTASAGDPITWYTTMYLTHASPTPTGGKVGVNAIPSVAFQVLGPTLSSAGVQNQYAFGVGNGSGYELTMGTDSSYAYIQSWASKPLYLQSQGNNLYINAGNTVFGGTTAYTKLQLNGSTGTTFTLYGIDNASGSYNQMQIAHKFNYTGTSQTDGGRIVFTRSNNVDGNYGAEMAFLTRPNGGSVTTAVTIDSLQRMLQNAGRKSNAYTLGNQQVWIGTITSLGSGGSFSLAAINGMYDNLAYELDIFVNRGGFFATKYAGVFGYNGFTTAVATGDTVGATLTKTGTLYNETMTITNGTGATINAYYFCLRVWGYNVSNNVSTGGTDLVTSSYLTRIE